jgi:hypothetical protein
MSLFSCRINRDAAAFVSAVCPFLLSFSVTCAAPSPPFAFFPAKGQELLFFASPTAGG